MAKVNSVSKTEAVDLIEKNGGKFATVTFTKNNGEERTINFNRSKSGTTKLGYLRVFDVKELGFKSVNPRTISALSIGGKKLTVK